jgi:hypothetical protein
MHDLRLSAWNAPVEPASGSDDVSYVTVNEDHPRCRTPSSAQVNRSCSRDGAADEGEARVLARAASLLCGQRPAGRRGYGV